MGCIIHTCMVVADRDPFKILSRDKNEPIYQWVYRVLRSNIIQLHLRPGQAVSETEISSRLDISRTPVREAFIRLGEYGLIDVKPQRHSVISRIDLEQAEETRFVRRSLEKSILKEACRDLRASCSGSACLDELAENLLIQEACLPIEDYDRLLTADDDFHRIIYRSCGKERVWSFIKKLDNSHDRLRIMTIPLIAERLIGEHRSIARLLRERRAEAADEMVDRHLTNAVINEVIHSYPAEYFKQDPHAYTRRPVLAS